VADMCGDILGAEEAATGLYCAPGENIQKWRDKGASLIVIGSDHSFLADGAKALRAAAQNHTNKSGSKL
jgi:2-keto-3-deoxy-L-rhamnonate aldolase RhmA